MWFSLSGIEMHGKTLVTYLDLGLWTSPDPFARVTKWTDVCFDTKFPKKLFPEFLQKSFKILSKNSKILLKISEIIENSSNVPFVSDCELADYDCQNVAKFNKDIFSLDKDIFLFDKINFHVIKYIFIQLKIFSL